MPTDPVTQWSVDDLVPHRGSLSLLTRVTHTSDSHARAEVDVSPASVFARPQGTPAWIGIEYMAQTIAAWAGARARGRGGRPRVGYLLGTRRYVAHEPWFSAGQTLEILVHCELIGANGLGQFSCAIRDPSGRELASAMVTVYEPGDDEANAPPTS
jgi:predicted hotdog family 3-hydroxylacyl-ACP dehydratase